MRLSHRLAIGLLAALTGLLAGMYGTGELGDGRGSGWLFVGSGFVLSAIGVQMGWNATSSRR